MTLQAVDSFSPHTDRSCAALAEQGIVGALRYQYNTSRAEVDRLHAHGLSFGLIFERNGNAAVVNPGAGTDHGHAAVAFARSIGLPEGCAIYFAEADTHVARSQFPGARAYWTAAAAVTRNAGYRCGAYGGSVLIDDLHGLGIVDLTWETGAMSWNEWVHSTTACLRQLMGQPTIGGVTVDLNDVQADDCGWWTPAGAQKPDTPTLPQPEEEDDMLKAPRKAFAAPKAGIWALRPDGKLTHIDGLEALAALSAPSEGQPPEIQLPIPVADTIIPVLVEFYNG